MAKAAPKPEQWAQLAGDLGVSRQSVYNWRKLEGAPMTNDVEAWRAFMAEHGLKAGGSRDLQTLKVLIAEQELEKKTRENQKAKGEIIEVAEAVAAAKRVTALWQMTLKAKLESEIPARVQGKDVAETRAEMTMVYDELNAELQRLLTLESSGTV